MLNLSHSCDLQIDIALLSGCEHVEDTSPCLADCRLDLVCGQREAVRSPVTEFVGVGVGSVTCSICVICRGSSGGVKRRAAGANCVGGARNTTDGSCGVGGQCAVCSIVVGADVAVVAVGPEMCQSVALKLNIFRERLPEDVLSIRVDVKIQADATRVLERLNLCDETAVLGCVTCSLALVCLGAGAGASSTGGRPLVRPVAVDISTDTALSTDGLAVLAPETISCLCVDKSIRVDNGHDVEVELVDDSLDARISGVLGE